MITGQLPIIHNKILMNVMGLDKDFLIVFKLDAVKLKQNLTFFICKNSGEITEHKLVKFNTDTNLNISLGFDMKSGRNILYNDRPFVLNGENQLEPPVGATQVGYFNYPYNKDYPVRARSKNILCYHKPELSKTDNLSWDFACQLTNGDYQLAVIDLKNNSLTKFDNLPVTPKYVAVNLEETMIFITNGQSFCIFDI